MAAPEPSPPEPGEAPRETVAPPAAEAPPSPLVNIRTLAFLKTQSRLIAFSSITMVAVSALGLLDDKVIFQSWAFIAVLGLLTLVGWVHYHRHGGGPRVVVTQLYLVSIVALLFFYLSGEFETPALAIGMLVVVMAPQYSKRIHAWGIAGLQIAMYLFLLAARQFNLFGDYLPYNFVIPQDSVTNPAFVADSIGTYLCAILGFAYLSGQATMDIVNTQEHLEAEVRAKTEEIEKASAALRASNERLAQANLDLVRKNEWLKQFNTAVSHDLRAPLQTITARAELMAMAAAHHPESQKIQEMSAAMVSTALRMARLIDDLMRLTRVGDSPGPVEFVPVDLLVGTISSDLSELIRAEGATIELIRPVPQLYGNRSLLQEVLQNLIENGIKYGRSPDPIVRIEGARAPEGFKAFAVEDNGGGIPLEHRQRIFNLFRRLEQHRHRDGVGAGLAIVHRIVEVHGGTVRVDDSAALGGARFIVTLPDAPAELYALAAGHEEHSTIRRKAIRLDTPQS